MSFLHGVEVIQIDNGTRPIRAVRSSVIGVVGTAPNADANKFPLNTPVLILGSRQDAAALGEDGTLPYAMDGIFDQIGAMVVVIRVEEGPTPADTISNVIGGVNTNTQQLEGAEALLGAETAVKVTPRILVAPGFTDIQAVADALISIADKLKAVVIADGPSTSDADAIAYRNNFGADRLYLVDPQVIIWDRFNSAEVVDPASARVAGVIAKSDHERGFWHSPSNRTIRGVLGLERPINFVMDDPNTQSNLLNAEEVSTIIHLEGYRLWGNRSTSSDPLWANLKRRRIADMLNESLIQAHLWALDRNITTQYAQDILDSVNLFGRHLVNIGALVDFSAWLDPDLNNVATLSANQLYVNFDWLDHPLAERITFLSEINNGYLNQVLPTAA
jgi:phage tail sheath protein FI